MSTEGESCQPRGLGLVSVVALPGKKPLSQTSVTEIELRKEWAFAVTIRNSGCAPERKIRVRAAISASEPGLTGQGQIEELFPGKEATVVIGHFALPPLDERLLLHVEIEPVPAEVNFDNNSADYPVRFLVS